MLKKYSFYGMTLELIVVMGIFFAVFIAILFWTWRKSVSERKRDVSSEIEKEQAKERHV